MGTGARLRNFSGPLTQTMYPDYAQYVTAPMDLGTVRSKLAAGRYGSAKEFRGDVELVYSNCIAYRRRAGTRRGDARLFSRRRVAGRRSCPYAVNARPTKPSSLQVLRPPAEKRVPFYDEDCEIGQSEV